MVTNIQKCQHVCQVLPFSPMFLHIFKMMWRTWAPLSDPSRVPAMSAFALSSSVSSLCCLLISYVLREMSFRFHLVRPLWHTVIHEPWTLSALVNGKRRLYVMWLIGMALSDLIQGDSCLPTAGGEVRSGSLVGSHNVREDIKLPTGSLLQLKTRLSHISE